MPSLLKTLLSNNVLTPLRPYPNLVNFSGRYIDSVSDTKRLLLNLAIVESSVVRRISDGESTSPDQMRCFPVVRVRRIVSAALSNCEDC